jgi:hypothetical protein
MGEEKRTNRLKYLSTMLNHTNANYLKPRPNLVGGILTPANEARSWKLLSLEKSSPPFFLGSLLLFTFFFLYTFLVSFFFFCPPPTLFIVLTHHVKSLLHC